MTKTSDITELDALDVQKVSAVADPANGTPFLVMKSAMRREEVPGYPGWWHVRKDEADDVQTAVTSGPGTLPKSKKLKRKGKQSNNAGDLSEQDIRGGQTDRRDADNIALKGTPNVKTRVNVDAVMKASLVTREQRILELQRVLHRAVAGHASPLAIDVAREGLAKELAAYQFEAQQTALAIARAQQAATGPSTYTPMGAAAQVASILPGAAQPYTPQPLDVAATSPGGDAQRRIKELSKQLEKALSDKGLNADHRAADLSQELTLARLRQAHEQGRI